MQPLFQANDKKVSKITNFPKKDFFVFLRNTKTDLSGGLGAKQ